MSDSQSQPSSSGPQDGVGKPHRGIYLLPNLLTTGALFAGFYAIVAAMNGRFGDACEALIIAAVLDGLDGRIARLTNTQSEFGVQYDSMSDLVCFGLAPALLVYLWSLAAMAEWGPLWAKVGWLASFLFAACAALRLARFNAQAGVADKRFFQGIASPAAAALLVTGVWICESEGVTGAGLQAPTLIVTLAAALLMVSNVRYYSFKSWPARVPFLWIFVVVIMLVLLALDPPKLLFTVAYLYAASGPVLTLIGRSRRKRLRHRIRQRRERERGGEAEPAATPLEARRADRAANDERHGPEVGSAADPGAAAGGDSRE
ncbi:MAG: phosphatidylcholine/phosphatidylserine synthase [Pseudomonadota bacterium]